ncbi:MAG: tetratricopeptide repeat protein, partial [Rudanella sp.]|nr:tetratricopeptide repeat protein [Rudanella sp.]
MNIVEIPARILFFLVALLLTIPAVMAVPLDRIQYRNLSGAARFKLTDKYLTAHWLNFYDPRQTTVAADLAMMREEATDDRTACLLRFFMFRNQAFEQTKHAETSATALAQMRDVLQFAQVNELIIEEGISWLLLSLITREHKSSMDERTRRIWAYEGAVKGLKLLERVPINELAAYHGGTYFLNHHLMYVGIYLFRIEEYELALRMFTLGQRAAHPSFDSHNPHFKRYAHFYWNLLNDVGECYRSMERYPEAIGAYRKAYLFGQKHRSVIQQAVSYGNIGTVLALQGKPTQALSYLSYAAQESARLGDCESEFNASSPLGSAYIACKQYEKAYPV